jgi:hypothetical protein
LVGRGAKLGLVRNVGLGLCSVLLRIGALGLERGVLLRVVLLGRCVIRVAELLLLG